MTLLDILLVVFIVVVVIAAAIYFLNRWASTRMVQQQRMIDQSRQTISIFTIDKRKLKPTEANLPKAVSEQLPKRYRLIKMPFVKAKVGPQIMTFMCDKRVFDAIPLQKNVKVDIAGIYIIDMKGLKSPQEIKKQRKEKKKAQK